MEAFLREGGVSSTLGSDTTCLKGRPYCILKTCCCFISKSAEYDGPICPIHAQNAITRASDMPIIIIPHPTDVRRLRL